MTIAYRSTIPVERLDRICKKVELKWLAGFVVKWCRRMHAASWFNVHEKVGQIGGCFVRCFVAESNSDCVVERWRENYYQKQCLFNVAHWIGHFCLLNLKLEIYGKLFLCIPSNLSHTSITSYSIRDNTISTSYWFFVSLWHKISVKYLKDACSKIVVKLIFLKLTDMVTFPTKISSKVKKFASIYFICKQFEKTMFMLSIIL